MSANKNSSSVVQTLLFSLLSISCQGSARRLGKRRLSDIIPLLGDLLFDHCQNLLECKCWIWNQVTFLGQLVSRPQAGVENIFLFLGPQSEIENFSVAIQEILATAH